MNVVDGMDYPRTERQARFMALADRLAERFAERAEGFDRSGEFPFENFRELEGRIAVRPATHAATCQSIMTRPGLPGVGARLCAPTIAPTQWWSL